MTRQQVQIEFAEEEERVRRVVSRSNHRVTGKHPGFKSGRMHYWESFLERDAFVRLDGDVEVISFCEQPAVLYYGDDMKLRHYPDVLVSYRNRQEFVEIKTDLEANSEEIITRTALLIPALACHGYGYRIWTESEIREHPSRLVNLRFLLRFGRKKLELHRFEWFRQLFGQQTVFPWNAIVGQPADTGKLEGLCRLILEGRLRIDLTRPIASDSLVGIGVI